MCTRDSVKQIVEEKEKKKEKIRKRKKRKNMSTHCNDKQNYISIVPRNQDLWDKVK